jgi:transitional endoplasmic reticulum ATPase
MPMPELESVADDSGAWPCGDGRATVVDGPGVLAAAEQERVELAHGATFPPPVGQVRLWVRAERRGGQLVYLLDGEVHAAPVGGPGLRVLGNDLLSVLLVRRMAAGDRWAVRVVDGLEGVTDAVNRRLGFEPAGGDSGRQPVVLTDERVGLRATVTVKDAVTTLRAAVPGQRMRPAHLAAMFGLVLRVVAERSAEPLAGGDYRLKRVEAAASVNPDRSDRVELDQVGGLADVVAQFREIAVSFRHPDVMARWGARRPQGILLYGPPGTGKTMLARALANEIGARFREIRTPEILDKWLGASERNIKRIFRDARQYRVPSILFFDEFDSIISYAGAGGDAASQAVNAVAGIFKQEMNTLVEENPNVIVVATTNFPHRMDESLIRSGRFDVVISVPRPDEAGRADILARIIRGLRGRYDVGGFRMFAGDLDLTALARASDGMTGADLREAVRRVQLARAMDEARDARPAPPIGQADLERSIMELRRAGRGHAAP